MELLPQTADVLRRLSESSDVDLVAVVTEAGDLVAAEVPSCLGSSYCLVDEDLAFTVVATSEDSTVMDAAQYLDDGPCLQAGRGEVVVGVEDVLDESRWQQYAATAADRGVRSSLSLPVLDGGRLVGTVNFYAALAGAFVGHEERLASIVGASARVAPPTPTCRSGPWATRPPHPRTSTTSSSSTGRAGCSRRPGASRSTTPARSCTAPPGGPACSPPTLHDR